MNAMPHWIFGITKTRMLSAFGFSPQANITYSVLNVVFAATFFQFQCGLSQFLGNGIALGALAVLVIYYLAGTFFLTLFQTK